MRTIMAVMMPHIFKKKKSFKIISFYIIVRTILEIEFKYKARVIFLWIEAIRFSNLENLELPKSTVYKKSQSNSKEWSLTEFEFLKN